MKNVTTVKTKKKHGFFKSFKLRVVSLVMAVLCVGGTVAAVPASAASQEEAVQSAGRQYLYNVVDSGLSAILSAAQLNPLANILASSGLSIFKDYLKTAILGGDSSNLVTNEQILDKLNSISQDLDKYYQNSDNNYKALAEQIDSKGFCQSTDRLGLDYKNTLSALNDRIGSIHDSGADIDKDTYRAYCGILSTETCKYANLRSDMEKVKSYVSGECSDTNYKPAYKEILNLLRSKTIVANNSTYGNFETAADYNADLKNYREFITRMEYNVLSDYTALNMLSSMEYKCWKYEQATGEHDSRINYLGSEQDYKNRVVYDTNMVAGIVRSFKDALSYLDYNMTTVNITATYTDGKTVTKGFPYYSYAVNCLENLLKKSDTYSAATFELRTNWTANWDTGMADYTNGLSADKFGFTKDGTLYFPSNRNVELTIQGNYHVIDLQNKTSIPVINIQGQNKINIKNVTFKGCGAKNAIVSSSFGGDGKKYLIDIDGCQFEGFSDAAVSLSPSYNVVNVNNCFFNDNKTGVRMYADVEATGSDYATNANMKCARGSYNIGNCRFIQTAGSAYSNNVQQIQNLGSLKYKNTDYTFSPMGNMYLKRNTTTKGDDFLSAAISNVAFINADKIIAKNGSVSQLVYVSKDQNCSSGNSQYSFSMMNGDAFVNSLANQYSGKTLV